MADHDSSDDEEASVDVPLYTEEYRSPLPNAPDLPKAVGNGAVSSAAFRSANVRGVLAKSVEGSTELQPGEALPDQQIVAAIKAENRKLRGTPKSKAQKTKKVKKVQRAMDKIDKSSQHQHKKKTIKLHKAHVRGQW